MAAREKVLLGFSGGVDSLAVARLLTLQGFEVVPLWLEMGGEGDRYLHSRARRAAAGLGLELAVEKVAGVFAAEVVDYLKNSYARAETPNPCIRCNAFVKFAGLAAAADRRGIEKLATGHYIRAEPELATGRGRSYHRALDAAKDQSYFLFLVPRKFLDRTLFPLGSRTKAAAFQLAADSGCDLANYRESQELCFLNGDNYRDFLSTAGPAGPGPGAIVNRRGEVLGRHSGLENYTVGQRRGLDVAWSEPLYVLRLDRENNRLVVGSRAETGCCEFTVADLNWLVEPRSAGEVEREVLCRIRHRHQPAPARIRPGKDLQTVVVEFFAPQFAVTPGQGAAFYDGDRLLGGGLIKSVEAEG